MSYVPDVSKQISLFIVTRKDQPYAEDASPNAQSPEYIPESDLEAHPEDDDDEDPEEDPVDYPADGGDVGDDKDGSSEDDEDDDMDIEADEEEEEEEEEHLAPADSADEEEEEEEEHLAPADSVVVLRLLAMSSPSASPLSPWSSPSPRIPFPPLPSILSPPSPMLSPAPPPSPIRSLSYRAAMIRLADTPSSGTPLLLPISASTSSPPLLLPSGSRREDRPEVTLPPWKRLGIALGPRYEVGESSSTAAARPAGGLRADYGFVATMDREIMRDSEREVGYGITEQDTDEIYMRLDDEQSERQLLAGRFNMLFRDRRAHAYTRHLMETEARLSRKAWIVISELLRADYRRSKEIIELRTTLQGHVTALQGQVLALQAHVTALHGQQGLARETYGTKTNYQVNNRPETINATSVTNAQLQAMIDQGVTATLAA
nr:hypothetical protein [Tanacetum cinerariifolium]